VPKIAGLLAGMSHPNFEFMIQRIRMAVGSPACKLLIEAGIPYEPDLVSAGTLVFEFPLSHSDIKPADEVSLWEAAWNLVTLQREWSDNAVSNTLNFKPAWETIEICAYEKLGGMSKKYGVDFETGLDHHGDTYQFGDYRAKVKWGKIQIQKHNVYNEEQDIEKVLSSIVPHIKSLSLLPHSAKGAYAQMPQEGITEAEYHRRVSEIKPIDWTKLNNSIAEPELYCSGPVCELPKG
jgi:hypothetical protein